MKKYLCLLIALFLLMVSHIPSYAAEIESLGVDIHGFVSQGFLKSTSYNYLANDANRGSFQFNEMGINFGKQVTDNLRIGAQLFARDLGDVANNKVTLDWAYGDYRFKDWLGVRGGRIKVPVGLYNETRDMDMLRACIILPQGLYNDLNRDTMIALNGGALYGTIPLSVAGSLEYQALVGQTSIDAESGIGKHIEANFPNTKLSNYNTDIQYLGALRWNTPLPGLALKATYWDGSTSHVPLKHDSLGDLNMSFKNKIQVYSAEFIWKDLTLSAEYQTVASDADITMLTTVGYYPAGTVISSTKQRAENYYIMGSYRFTHWLEAGAYYTEMFPDASASGKNGDRYSGANQHNFWAWQKDAALFARFDVNSHMILKVEGHYVDGAANVLSVDNPTRDDKNWWYFAAKATFSF